jgi:hypothetical protein
MVISTGRIPQVTPWWGFLISTGGQGHCVTQCENESLRIQRHLGIRRLTALDMWEQGAKIDCFPHLVLHLIELWTSQVNSNMCKRGSLEVPVTK